MSLWSNSLVLPNIDVIDRAKFDTEAKIASLPQALSLRGRHLEGAVFIFADLRKVDFSAAKLRDAVLSGADLRNTKFECVSRAGTQLECPDLRGATLFGAKLQGVSLDGVQLTRAILPRAQMQGASLRKAPLQGAWLQGAQLQGARLDDAVLWGAHFENPPPMFELDLTQLQGALPTSAEVLSVTSAQLQGASLNGAQLQGASLVDTQLQAASLDGAQLQGAYLVNTQLQGASLVGAQLQGAAFIKPFTWRAQVTESNGQGTLVSEPENRPKYHTLGCAFEPWGCDWSSGAFTDLKRLIERQVPEGDRRNAALNRITILDPAKGWPGEREKEKAWTDLVQSSPSLDVYEKGLAVQLQEMGCDAARGPYVIPGFLFNPTSARFVKGSSGWTALADAFLDEAHCPAARALAGADRILLQVVGPIAKLLQVQAQIATCWSAEYNVPEAEPLRAHVPYDATEATPEQLVDRSFATDGEIEALKAISPGVNECEQHFLAQLSTVSPALVPKVSASYGMAVETATLLIDRKITWGEYNTKRRATAMEQRSQMTAELQRISQGPH